MPGAVLHNWSRRDEAMRLNSRDASYIVNCLNSWREEGTASVIFVDDTLRVAQTLLFLGEDNRCTRRIEDGDGISRYVNYFHAATSRRSESWEVPERYRVLPNAWIWDLTEDKFCSLRRLSYTVQTRTNFGGHRFVKTEFVSVVVDWTIDTQELGQETQISI